MNKNTKKSQSPLLSDELVIDGEGRLRVSPQTPKGTFQQMRQQFSSSSIFLTCGVLTILLVDVLLLIAAVVLQEKYLLHNPDANSLFVPFLVMLLLGVTGSLSLLLFVIYKINLPYFQKGEVVVEVDTK